MSSYPPRNTQNPPPPGLQPAPNAALLIDFDNVTMGVRSDLGKEMKMLLNSEVFRGKIAVRRAYADWRRYPNYVVPLSESSVDLIFAPAYGTSKKNATDLRMAVDAIELAFMRPEIGTFILLTGDSDFTSCVVKLKEYGKYVIGVGMRESSSDLLIQNCDEYYSYHALSGLTRATSGGDAKEDPWLLVKRAAQQMARDGDAMRSDRLKQVMIDLDPGFDEKALGYSKFSRFVSDAQAKGLLHLKRVENGQYEIVPDRDGGTAGTAGTAAPDFDEPRERDRDRDRDRDRGRGRGRGRGRYGDRYERGESSAPVAADAASPEAESDAATEMPVAAEAPRVLEPRAEVEAAPPATGAGTGRVDNLETAYALLQHTVRSVVGGRIGQTVRDGDVKRRMLDAAPDFDESKLGFSKFSRFLRQAHDAEVIDLRRLGEGSYEVALPASGTKLPPPSLAPAAPRAEGAEAAPEPQAERGGRGRGRGRGRGPRPDAAPELLPGQVAVPASGFAEPDVEVPRAVADAPVDGAHPIRTEAPARHEEPREAPVAPVTAPAAETRQAAETARVGVRGRGGRRGRGAVSEGPPPLLPGQAVPSSRAAAAPPTPSVVATGVSSGTPLVEPDVEVPSVPAPEAGAEDADGPRGPGRSRRGRGRGRGRGGDEGAGTDGTPEAPSAPAAEPVAAAPAAASAGGGEDAMGLPTDTDAIERYITTAYRGVGRATAKMLTQAFGTNVFAAMREDPDSVRTLLGRRAESLLDQWGEDLARRTGGQPASASTEAPAAAPIETSAEAPAADAPAATSEDTAPASSRSRGRRGGRGRGRGAGVDPTDRGDAAPAGAAEAPAETAPEAAAPAVTEEQSAPAGDAGADDAAETPRKSRSRSRSGRKRAGGAGAADSAAAEPVAESPAPAATPAPRKARKSRARGTAAAPAVEAAPEAPTPAPQAADDATARPRRPRGRGRGRAGGAAE